MKTNTFFPIRVLEQKSGIKSSTLRAWERRYGLIKPKRTPKGHRLYNQSDLSRVLRIKELLEDGHTFINIKNIIDHEGAEDIIQANQRNMWDETITNIKSAVSDFSYNRIDNIYNDIASIYPIELVSDKLLQPLLKFYSQESTDIAEVGFFNKWLQIRLTSRFHYDNIKNNNSKKVIFVSDFNKEASLMMLSNMVITLGYQALFFGSLLPFNLVNKVVKKSAARAIFIAPSKRQIKDKLFIEFIKDSESPIFVYGDFDDETYSDVFKQNNVYYLGHSNPIAINLYRKHMFNIFHE